MAIELLAKKASLLSHIRTKFIKPDLPGAYDYLQALTDLYIVKALTYDYIT